MPPTDPSEPALCDTCGYDLRTLSAGTKCPECGSVPHPGVKLPGRAVMGLRVLLVSFPLLMAELSFSSRRDPTGQDIAAVDLRNVAEACQVATILAAAAGLGVLAGSLPPPTKWVRWSGWAIAGLALLGIVLVSGSEPTRKMPFETLTSLRWSLPLPISIPGLSWWVNRAVEICFPAGVLLVCARWAYTTGYPLASALMTRAAACSASAVLLAWLAVIAWVTVHTQQPPRPIPTPGATTPWTPPLIDTVLKSAGDSATPVLLFSLLAAWWAVTWLLGGDREGPRARLGANA